MAIILKEAMIKLQELYAKEEEEDTNSLNIFLLLVFCLTEFLFCIFFYFLYSPKSC
jgi:hypothetical protein